MEGIILQVDESDTHLNVQIKPEELQGNLDVKSLLNAIKNSEFGDFYINDEAVLKLLANLQKAIKNESNDTLIEQVGERRDNDVKCKIEEGLLSATLSITKGYGASQLTIEDLVSLAENNKVQRGLSHKRVYALLPKDYRLKTAVHQNYSL